MKLKLKSYSEINYYQNSNLLLFVLFYFVLSLLFILHSDKLTNLKLGSRIIAGRVDPEPPDILEENVTISSLYGNVCKTLIEV